MNLPLLSRLRDWHFGDLAAAAARWFGSPAAFYLAFGSVALWAATGPHFDYSENWQIVINTATTIVTFLMVFLVQNTQNRDMAAIHLKLDELIIATDNARNEVAAAENLPDAEIVAMKVTAVGDPA